MLYHFILLIYLICSSHIDKCTFKSWLYFFLICFFMHIIPHLCKNYFSKRSSFGAAVIIMFASPLLFQAKSCICHMCGAHLNRLHSCLYCVFFACFAKKHIHEHAKSKRHNLGEAQTNPLLSAVVPRGVHWSGCDRSDPRTTKRQASTPAISPRWLNDFVSMMNLNKHPHTLQSGVLLSNQRLLTG